MEIDIKITGSGPVDKIAHRLRDIARQLEDGQHVKGVEEKGEVEWEDGYLMTTIKED